MTLCTDPDVAPCCQPSVGARPHWLFRCQPVDRWPCWRALAYESAARWPCSPTRNAASYSAREQDWVWEPIFCFSPRLVARARKPVRIKV